MSEDLSNSKYETSIVQCVLTHGWCLKFGDSSTLADALIGSQFNMSPTENQALQIYARLLPGTTRKDMLLIVYEAEAKANTKTPQDYVKWIANRWYSAFPARFEKKRIYFDNNLPV